jgi:alkylhydroperoxidase family enzyme
MPRLAQVPRAEAPPEVLEMYQRLFGDRDPVAEPGTATGTPGNWWTVFAQSADVFASAVGQFGLFNSRKRHLDPVLRELAITRTGFAAGSQFVYSQHCKAARAAGVSDVKVAEISSWASSGLFEPRERAVLAYVDEVVLQDGRVQDATFARLREQIDEVAILELTFVTATYKLHATICRALRLEYDDVPERVVEVAAPGQEGAAADVMTQISRESS